MDTQEFIGRLVPSGGKFVTARLVQKDDRRVWRHYVHDTSEEAARRVLELSDSGTDAYFALASYKQGFYTDDKGRKRVRTQENVKALQALWFDIDLKDGYDTPTDAIRAVKEFVTQVGIPQPSAVVDSGHGLHVYWCLDTPVERPRWQGLSEALKGAAKTLGLKVDLVCTADAARVLRPIGTMNFKGDPKDVKLLGATWKQHSLQAFEEWMLPYKPSVRVRGGVNDELGGGMEGTPKKFELVVRHCGVAQYAVATGGREASEPEWMAMLQLLRHCEDGARFIHHVSDKHPDYSAPATERKFDQRSTEYGPTTCETFRSYRPASCKGCPFAGTIKSPIQLGVPDVDDPNAYPAGYRRRKDGPGVERSIKDTDSGITEWYLVFPYTPMSVFRYFNNTDRRFATEVVIAGPKLEHVVVLSGEDFANPRQMRASFESAGVTLHDTEFKEFKTFMTSWLQQVQAKRGAHEAFAQLGWTPDGTGFGVIPTLYRGHTATNATLRPAREHEAHARFYEPKGELEVWKQAAQFLVAQNNPKLIVALAASFGSPLLRFSGVNGGIVSLMSTASGVGKSFSLKVAQAVWGTPAGGGIHSTHDTENAVHSKAAFLQNLPVVWDEIRGKTVVDFTSFAFRICQGVEKSRLASDTSARDVRSWNLLVIGASNESLFDAMSRMGDGQDAGMRRVFEVEMSPLPDSADGHKALQLTTALTHNYGRAGHLLADYYATNREAVEREFNEALGRLFKPRPKEERVWWVTVAAMILGMKYATKLGLIEGVDLHVFYEFLRQQVDVLVGRVTTNKEDRTAIDYVTGFLHANGHKTMVIETAPQCTTGRYAHAKYEPVVLAAPKGEQLAVVRYVKDKQVVLSQVEFVEYVRKLNGGHYSHTVMKELKEDYGAFVARRNWTPNTNFSALHWRGVVIPLDHPKLVNSSGLDEIPDLPNESEPEDSTESSSPP